jgi:formylglycine-generating enzyme required for sulfatase activity
MKIGSESSAAISPDFVDLAAGRFLMGDHAGRPDEQPVHVVVLPAFSIARLPVTNAEYGRYQAAVGGRRPRFWTDERFNAPQQPVVGVSWTQAVTYCEWLTVQIGRRCRLPSEAEWEFAARGGLTGTTYAWGVLPPIVDGEYLACIEQDRPAPVGISPPNGFGLLDMGFNIHEWCLDWYDPTYYKRSPIEQPLGPESGTRRASRGGAWRHQLKVCRCAARSSLPFEYRYNDYGFRLVAELP